MENLVMENLVNICVTVMLICFGISWPISVYKSLKTKSTKGKSVVFTFAIIIGYIIGLTGKIIELSAGIRIVNWLSWFTVGVYAFNLVVVSTDLVIYFINRKNELKQEAIEAETVKEEENKD